MPLHARGIARAWHGTPGAGHAGQQPCVLAGYPRAGRAGGHALCLQVEVADWPLIGRLARAGGTEFHRRGGGSQGTRKLIARRTGHLENGQSVTVFPEGTTTLGATTRRFQPRLFAAAIESRRPVVPVLLRYGPDPETATLAPYVGDDVFVPHLLRMLQRQRIVVDVWFLEPVPTVAADRSAVAKDAQRAIDERLALNPPELLPDRAPALPRHRLST